ncbi:MAG: methionyl-tRNA formyltransferase [Clostridia bacterium]|nr:methionyl-tRNA formyltransferase [Clostridia bacterium]
MNKKDIKIVFMGTPEFSCVVLRAVVNEGYNVSLVVTQPDKPVGRKHVITPPDLKVCAEELGIEVYQPNSMRTDEAFDAVSEQAPDLIITAAYGKILPERILNIPRLGNINVHASLLPKYRGASPVQSCLLNGDEITGVTIMNMDVGMDTGAMLSHEELKITPNIHYDELMSELAEVGAKLLVETLPSYIDGNIVPVPQNDDEAVNCFPITPDMGEFNWDFSAQKIHNIVRALSTWPGAYVLNDGNKLKVYDTEVVEVFDESTLPFEVKNGMILKAHKSDLIIKCDNSYINLKELQVPGGKRLKSSDCAHNFKVGTFI